MNIKTVKNNNANIVIISGKEIVIKNAQDALDLMAEIRYEYESDIMIMNKENITEDFFDLKNGIAGEIMQKYINYGMKLGIVGDFSGYKSKSLRSLIYESNKAKRIIFTDNEEEAVSIFIKEHR